MTRRIFLLHDDNRFISMDHHEYESESLLQELIAKHPDLLAGGESAEGDERRWLLVTREMGVPGELDGANRWSLDHLFIDNDGVPTLVEVKRASDSRIRREVVGQLLDYAANAVVHWPVDRIRDRFLKRCAEDESDPAVEITNLIGSAASEAAFWVTVESNLALGRVRLVFVADSIPSELRRIVEFLNEQMDPAEVIAVEVAQFVGHGLITLVPSLIGESDRARKRRASAEPVREPSTEAAFLETFADAPPETRAALDAVMAHLRGLGYRDAFTRGARLLSYLPCLRVGERDVYPFSIRRGRPVFQGRFITGYPPFEESEAVGELRAALDRVPGIRYKDAGVTGYPEVPWTTLVTPAGREAFLAFVSWLTGRLRQG
jgi:hypothetical protein